MTIGSGSAGKGFGRLPGLCVGGVGASVIDRRSAMVAPAVLLLWEHDFADELLAPRARFERAVAHGKIRGSGFLHRRCSRFHGGRIEVVWLDFADLAVAD